MEPRLIGLALVFVLAACASGSVVITGSKRPPISPSEVQLYSRAPATYEVIGIVKASSEMGWTEQGSMDYAVEELKKQAAAIGANGVIVTTVGDKGSLSYGDISQTVSGEAIYVSNK